MSLVYKRVFILYCFFLLSTERVSAAGFYLQEQSVAGLGQAFAGMGAMPEDASIIFFNPAGMTALEGAQMQVGAHLLAPRATLRNRDSRAATAATGNAFTPFTGNDGGNPYDPALIPNAYVAFPAARDWWLGLGVSVPFGLANEYHEGWFGRYDSTASELRTIEFAPSIAWAVSESLSLGGGVNIQSVNVGLDNAIPSPATAGGPDASTDGHQNLSADSVGAGFNAGLLWTPREGTRLGLHYRGEIDHLLVGRAIITNPLDIAGIGGDTTKVGGRAELTLPDIASLSLAQDLTPRLTLLAGLTWFDWSDYSRMYVALDNGSASNARMNFKDTVAGAVGVRFVASEEWTLRAGYQYDPTPTQDGFRSTRTPDGDRHWIAAGASYRWSEHVTLDLSGAWIDLADGPIELTRRFTTGTVNTRGTVGGETGILALGVSYRF